MITVRNRYLRCVKAIPSCPMLDVGDLVWKVGHHIEPGGYEYVTLRRRGDLMRFSVRLSHLEDHFEIVEVDDEYGA